MVVVYRNPLPTFGVYPWKVRLVWSFPESCSRSLTSPFRVFNVSTRPSKVSREGLFGLVTGIVSEGKLSLTVFLKSLLLQMVTLHKFLSLFFNSILIYSFISFSYV